MISGALIEQEGIDDHHIFPAAWLEKQGVDSSRRRDCVLNRTLIDRTTNQRISARAPSDYLSEIRRTLGFPFEAVMASHTLPVGPGSPLLGDDFEAFIDWRLSRIWDEIRRVTGLREAADTELEDGEKA